MKGGYSVEFPGVEQFRAWLLSRQNEVVGESGNSWECPLAHWLSAAYGRPMWVGLGEYNSLENTEFGVSCPQWASRFESLVDNTFAGLPVTGLEALSLLEALAEAEVL
jgi:hypothetical protein